MIVLFPFLFVAILGYKKKINENKCRIKIQSPFQKSKRLFKEIDFQKIKCGVRKSNIKEKSIYLNLILFLIAFDIYLMKTNSEFYTWLNFIV